MIKQIVLTEEEYSILVTGYKEEKQFIFDLIVGLKNKFGKEAAEEFITEIGYNIPTSHTPIGKGPITVNLIKEYDYRVQN